MLWTILQYDTVPWESHPFYDLETKQGTSFFTGISSFLKLHGEQELRKVIKEILSMTTAGHVVVVTYQCHKYMDFKDPRFQLRIASSFSADVLSTETAKDSIPLIV